MRRTQRWNQKTLGREIPKADARVYRPWRVRECYFVARLEEGDDALVRKGGFDVRGKGMGRKGIETVSGPRDRRSGTAFAMASTLARGVGSGMGG